MSDAGPYDAIQALCRELNELCLSVNILAPEDRDDLTPDQLREGLEAIAQQVAKEANRFVVVLLTTTVDHDGAEFLAQSVLSKAQQFLSCAQLYLRYFGRPLREQLGNHVRRILHAVSEAIPRAAAMERAGQSQMEPAQLMGQVFDLCETVPKLPKTDVSVTARKIIEVAVLVRDSLEELASEREGTIEGPPTREELRDALEEAGLDSAESKEEEPPASGEEDLDMLRFGEDDDEEWGVLGTARHYRCVHALEGVRTVLKHSMATVNGLGRHMRHFTGPSDDPVRRKRQQWLERVSDAVHTMNDAVIDVAAAGSDPCDEEEVEAAGRALEGSLRQLRRAVLCDVDEADACAGGGGDDGDAEDSGLAGEDDAAREIPDELIPSLQKNRKTVQETLADALGRARGVRVPVREELEANGPADNRPWILQGTLEGAQ